MVTHFCLKMQRGFGKHVTSSIFKQTCFMLVTVLTEMHPASTALLILVYTIPICIFKNNFVFQNPMILKPKVLL